MYLTTKQMLLKVGFLTYPIAVWICCGLSFKISQNQYYNESEMHSPSSQEVIVQNHVDSQIDSSSLNILN